MRSISTSGTGVWRGVAAVVAIAIVANPVRATSKTETPAMFTVDPLTRYVHITYTVPSDAPPEVVVHCEWSPSGRGQWQPAKVMPYVSETGLELAREAEWTQWVRGRITERRAAGLVRTVVFNPYPEVQQAGHVKADVRIRVLTPDGREIAAYTVSVAADNTDVVTLEDWTQVLQKVAVATQPEDGKWTCRTDLGSGGRASMGNRLEGRSGPHVPLTPLTYPLAQRGWYAMFVCTPPRHGVKLRLTGDERADRLGSRHAGEEVFWRWARLGRQHLVVEQLHGYTGYATAALDYVRLVPLADELVEQLESRFGGEADRLVAGYWEPYSWAFGENVRHPLRHREPLLAFAEARIALVDAQIGRFGAKVVYESRQTDQLLYATRGDPTDSDAHPTTDNVGRMQQYTNTLETELRHARDLGLRLHANFGASNCYPGSPLQGDFSKAHPEWMRGSALRYEVPEVRQYVLRLYREALEIGAPGISLDFCRYPETIDTVETCNTILCELRALADEFAGQRGQPVPILVRFPGTGVRRAKLFDYRTWAREGWVDYLCPSNIQGRHLHIDVAPYLAAVKGTTCKLLPCVDGLSWGLPMPGPFLWRVARLYEAGVDGVYVYQADARVLGKPGHRRCMRMLASNRAVAEFWQEDARLRPKRSKGIYLRPPCYTKGYHGWERLRVWLEGIEMGELEIYLDDRLVSRFDGPPYLAGTEEYGSDRVIPRGKHRLRVRARDGDGWLEQTFTVAGAG